MSERQQPHLSPASDPLGAGTPIAALGLRVAIVFIVAGLEGETMQRDAPSEGVERREMVRSMLTATLWAAAASVALSMLLGSFGAGYYVGYAEAWRDAVGRNALTLTSNRIDR